MEYTDKLKKRILRLTTQTATVNITIDGQTIEVDCAISFDPAKNTFILRSPNNTDPPFINIYIDQPEWKKIV